MENEFTSEEIIEDNFSASITSKLEKDIEDLKKENNILKFTLVLCSIIFINILVFPNFQSWAPTVSITVLEVVFLIILGRYLDVSDVEVITDKLLSAVGRNKQR